MLHSLLFVPGARPERFDKARAAGAHMVCIDLEDAVPPDAKATARSATLDYLRALEPGARVGLRLNGLRTPAGIADLAALAESGLRPPLVMLPKAATGEDLAIVAAVLGRADRYLWPIVESAEGLRRAWEIAAAPSVAGVLFGGADFSADIGAKLEWEPMFHARATLVAACAAAGVDLLDVPHIDVNDDAGLSSEIRRIRAMGFTGKACIHPKQVALVNAGFAPTDAEVAHARRVMEAFDNAKGAAALLDGKLIELPVIRAARRTLEAAKG
jgi:citrate lyase subunit beta/citryl-CoA lyase/(S)-citramalyl-CoA lyase